jgi:hypothetical protein
MDARELPVSISAATYQARQTEKEFQATVVKTARQFGWLVFHFPNAIINPIFPDLLMFRDGQTLMAELKTERGKLSVAQAALLLDLDAHGVQVHLWRPSDWDEIEQTLKVAN